MCTQGSRQQYKVKKNSCDTSVSISETLGAHSLYPIQCVLGKIEFFWGGNPLKLTCICFYDSYIIESLISFLYDTRNTMKGLQMDNYNLKVLGKSVGG